MMFPMQTIAAIQPSWRTYDWDYVGGMMAFESKPSFIDTRFDSFEHLGIMQDPAASCRDKTPLSCWTSTASIMPS